ncbi:uncharacterized protein LOC115874434 [Sitophilus oryzae]|uniref:Uncharacterized protein LOC115874434 n=1 Tax=Sitophilus oryzae TaxID=7048 RepID=A0A6J2X2U9_SITOR|nr:uncharacterized protein LOC115874434 [Sitophilus oryzae]
MAEVRTKYNSGVSPPIGSPGRTVVTDMSNATDTKNTLLRKPIKIGIWNVQSMFTRGKIHNVYAPTVDSDDEEVKSFYKEIDDVMKLTKNKDVTLLLGDMNVKIGQGSCGKLIGRYGLGERNERGDRLLQYCQENSMIITNTFFKLPKRRLYTWKSPRDNENRIVRNQIDYIILNQRYRNAMKSVKTYPGADVGSDHNLLVTEIMVKLKKLKVLSNQRSIDTSLLRSNNAKVKVYQGINENLSKLINCCSATQSQPEDMWQSLKSAIIEPCKKYLKPEKRTMRNDWMTDEILMLMGERRNLKNTEEYKRIQKVIKYKCRQAREEWITEECTEIENLQRLHDSHNGDIVLDIKDQLTLWEQYIETLFNHQREEITTSTNNEMGPSILKKEVQAAIKAAKDGKVPGPEDLPADALKLIEMNNT